MLYNAFGFEPPLFAHLPIILGPDRSKLSKRHGAVSILEYKEQGYLPEAMMNFLALLGWALDDRTELFTRDELFEHFSIERISQTSAIFNKEKLDWMNGVYIRQLSPEEFLKRALPVLEKELPPEVKRPLDQAYVARVLPLIQERVKTLKEAGQKELTWFFFIDELDYPAEWLIDKKLDKATTVAMLEAVIKRLVPLENFDAATLENQLRPMAAELNLKDRATCSVPYARRLPG